MTRFVSSSMEALSQLDQIMPRVLVDVEVSFGTYVYACDGVRPLYALGNTYTPVGPFGGVDNMREDSDPYPSTLRLWLSAVGSSSVYASGAEAMFNNDVRVYRTFLDTATEAQVSTPELLWKGKVDNAVLHIMDADKGNYVEIECRSTLHKRTVATYFNRETLWLTYSGDTFYQWLEQIPLTKTLWGQKATVFAAGGINIMDGGGARRPDAPRRQV